MLDVNCRNLLLVDSSQDIARLLAQLLKKKIPSVDIQIALSIPDSLSQLQSDSFLACIASLDLNAKESFVLIDTLVSQNIPTILIVDSMQDKIRKNINEIGYIDYAYKDSSNVYAYITKSIRRLIRNSKTKVLVVEDSALFREILKDTLITQLFTVLTASNGKEALETIENNEDIKLVVTDYIMPEVDGFELTLKIREKHQKDKIAIIAISAAEGQNSTIEKFLKYGANDYIKKPFSKQELIYRINNTMEYIALIEAQRHMANTDYLTGVYNRRHLMDTMNVIHANAIRGNFEYTVGILDIDFFKKVNDTYGHDIGDAVIKDLAHMLKTTFRSSDIVSRIGGEEFCIVLPNTKDHDSIATFEKIRSIIENRSITTKSHGEIKYTISIGVCARLSTTFDEMMKEADEMLYEAKQSGRNRVCIKN